MILSTPTEIICLRYVNPQKEMKYSDGRINYVEPAKGTEQFVAIDMDSGGYPYPVDTWLIASRFTNLKEARAYANSFPELEVVKITIPTITIEVVTN